ncbi:MAG: hypothetical protein KDJ25_04650 [Rhodoblastus sp.]|nr:hypothetical protein [Rhodoblastus sp.]
MIIEITSEEIAWATLQKVIHRQIDTENTTLSFEKADWARFSVKFRGGKFDQSLTPSTMRGFIEFQNALYHTVGVIVRDDPAINKFTDLERERYELVFTVRSGSSDVEAEGKGSLIDLGKEALKKMSGRQTMILLLVTALLYFGKEGVSTYLTSIAEEKRIAATSERDQALIALSKEITASDQRKIEIMHEALRASQRARDVNEFKSQANDAILRNSSQADEVVLQGKNLDRQVVSSINRSTRRKAEERFIDGIYLVVGVDTSDPEVIRVKLQERDNDDSVVTAELDDLMIQQQFSGVIQRAEWQRKPIKVRMSARFVGNDIQYAKILKASSLRKK